MVKAIYKELIAAGLEFYEAAEQQEPSSLLHPNELRERINLELQENSVSSLEIKNFVSDYFKYSTNTIHKKYMNQLWSKVELSSIVGEFLTTVSNTSMFTYEVAPVLTLMEQQMIERISKFVWNEDVKADGVMTSGGSASNLQAMMVARNTRFPKVKEEGYLGYGELKPIILCADNAHYSVKRAANILGLGHRNLVEVKTNSKGIMQADTVLETLDELQSQGHKPFMLISTAGTTVEGAFDELDSLGTVCQKHNLWFHIDGAYGASVLLSEKYRYKVQGISHCDSISWDFHKILGMNLTCAFLLIKNRGLLKSTLTSGNDSYLFHEEDNEIDQGPKSLQCGRRPDIMKLWLSWMMEGRLGLEARVDAMIESAQEFSRLVTTFDELELMFEPQFVNICFRLKNKDIKNVREKMLERGLGFINFSEDEKGTYLRMVVSRPDLSSADHKQILDTIVSLANEA